MMNIRYISVVLIAMAYLSVGTSFAEETIDYDAIKDAGYGNTSEVLKKMTPEQREDIIKQAKLMQHEVDKMSPQELEELKKQMLEVDQSVNPKTIDAKKLPTKETNNLKEIKRNLKKYQQEKK